MHPSSHIHLKFASRALLLLFFTNLVRAYCVQDRFGNLDCGPRMSTGSILATGIGLLILIALLAACYGRYRRTRLQATSLSYIPNASTQPYNPNPQPLPQYGHGYGQQQSNGPADMPPSAYRDQVKYPPPPPPYATPGPVPGSTDAQQANASQAQAQLTSAPAPAYAAPAYPPPTFPAPAFPSPAYVPPQ